MSKVNVGLVQMSCTNNKEEDLSKAIEGVKKAASQVVSKTKPSQEMEGF